MRPSPSHARRLLANALRRLAERLAPADQTPAPTPDPPADWLDRVRRGAPELLKGRAIEVAEGRPSGPQSAPELPDATAEGFDPAPPSRLAVPKLGGTVETRHRGTSPSAETQPAPRVRALRDLRRPEPQPRRPTPSPPPTPNAQVKARADLAFRSRPSQAPPPPTYSTVTARAALPEWAMAGARSVRPPAERIPGMPRTRREAAAWPSLPDARATRAPIPAATPPPVATAPRTATEVVEPPAPPRTPAPGATGEPPHPWPELPDPEPPEQEQADEGEAVAVLLLLQDHERRLDREQRG